jgi:hypothetical protein
MRKRIVFFCVAIVTIMGIYAVRYKIPAENEKREYVEAFLDGVIAGCGYREFSREVRDMCINEAVGDNYPAKLAE